MIKGKIISGDIGSVNNELNKFLQEVEEVKNIAQSQSDGNVIMTILYIPKKNVEEKVPLLD